MVLTCVDFFACQYQLSKQVEAMSYSSLPIPSAQEYHMHLPYSVSNYGRLKFDILKSEYYLREFQNRPPEIENRPLEIENRPHFVNCPVSSCTDEPHLERVNSSTTFLVSAVLKGLIPQFYIYTPSSSII
jgi:hypothetical protein